MGGLGHALAQDSQGEVRLKFSAFQTDIYEHVRHPYICAYVHMGSTTRA